MQPTQVEIQDCCSETNLCSFGQGQCDSANRNADCQGNLICETNTDTCGMYVQENGMKNRRYQIPRQFCILEQSQFCEIRSGM